MEFGDRIIVKGGLRRIHRHAKIKGGFSYFDIKEWERETWEIQKKGIFLGYRTLYNGERSFYSEEGYSFTPTEHFKAALVCCNGRENPFYTALEDIVVSNEKQ